MDMKAFEITTKMMVGEDVTEEEKSYARNYNAKYSIVRYLVMEKLGADNLKNFHFTPGEDFMNTPTIDVVNSLLGVFTDIVFTGIENARLEPFKFNDSNAQSNPPTTGMPKMNLSSPPVSVWEKD